MVLRHGNMFDVWGRDDLFLFTSNPIVNARGLAVMGRGMARQLADRHPKIREDFGTILTCSAFFPPVGEIGVYDDQTVGYFMVKRDWSMPAELPLIENSTHYLGAIAYQYDRINLNFPGIGNGNLRREWVLPIIELLPDNVHVWEYE